MRLLSLLWTALGYENAVKAQHLLLWMSDRSPFPDTDESVVMKTLQPIKKNVKKLYDPPGNRIQFGGFQHVGCGVQLHLYRYSVHVH